MTLPHILPSTFPPPPVAITVSSSTTSAVAASSSETSSAPSSSARPKSTRHAQAARARKSVAPQRCPHCQSELALPALLAQHVRTAEIVTRLTVERESVTCAVYAHVVGVSPTKARHALNSAASAKLLARRREQGRDGHYRYRYDPTWHTYAYLASTSLARSLQRWLTDSDAFA